MYEGAEAMFGLDGNILRGSLAPKASRLIKEWADTHQVDLQENWKRAESNIPLNWIEPLRQELTVLDNIPHIIEAVHVKDYIIKI